MNAIRPHQHVCSRVDGFSHRSSPLRGLAAVAVGLLLLTGLTPSALAAKRIALVIGNNTYREEPLANAVADSRLMSGVLQRCGFEVIAVENAGIAAFNKALHDFKEKAKAADAEIGIIFYAGHGMEVNKVNYLLPVDATLEEEHELRTQTIRLDTMLEDMVDSGVDVRLAILDCCRNNPLSAANRGWLRKRSGFAGGLAQPSDENLPEASCVLYSAKAGQTADDGADGTNSLFTRTLATRLSMPGGTLFDRLYETIDDVALATGKRQEPSIYHDGSPMAFRQLVLNPNAVAVGNTPAPANLPANPLPAIGNTPSDPAMVPVPLTGNGVVLPMPETAPLILPHGPPAPLPASGYWSNLEVFAGGPYAAHNDYSRREILKSAQQKLTEAGSADGRMGRKTQEALLKYQAAAGLPVTGRLDQPTLAQMGLLGIAEKAQPAGVSNSGRSYRGSSRRSSGGGGSLPMRAFGAGFRAATGL